MVYLIILVSIIIVLLLVKKAGVKKQQGQPDIPTDIVLQQLLEEEVVYYQELTKPDQERFRRRTLRFLQEVRITGIKTTVTPLDRILVAAGAIIPIFYFEDWEYPNINEVLLYPGSFGRGFEMEGNERNTLGMVGEGALQNVMLLSQQDLRNGFNQLQRPANTAIHEFVHLIDKADGAVDGIPELLMSHSYSIPWLKRMHEEMKAIREGDSDINPYALTNQAEFLAVLAEYFFKQPEKLQEHHPKLYAMLEKMFIRSTPAE